MKKICISLMILAVVGCTKSTLDQQLPIKEIENHYNRDSSRTNVASKIMMVAWYTNGVGISGSAKDSMPIVGPISTSAGYRSYSDWQPGYIYFVNTNESWEIYFFHPMSEPAELPPDLNKVTEYVFWRELK
jgi:hypothetical protein